MTSRCPRCSGALLKDYGTLECLACSYRPGDRLTPEDADRLRRECEQGERGAGRPLRIVHVTRRWRPEDVQLELLTVDDAVEVAP